MLVKAERAHTICAEMGTRPLKKAESGQCFQELPTVRIAPEYELPVAAWMGAMSMAGRSGGRVAALKTVYNSFVHPLS